MFLFHIITHIDRGQSCSSPCINTSFTCVLALRWTMLLMRSWLCHEEIIYRLFIQTPQRRDMHFVWSAEGGQIFTLHAHIYKSALRRREQTQSFANKCLRIVTLQPLSLVTFQWFFFFPLCLSMIEKKNSYDEGDRRL